MPDADTINHFNIAEIFSSDKYVIPRYQRNYAWREPEIHQLVQDIWDFVERKSKNNYYIGTLIVYERKQSGNPIYETIDGQQRLTTLNILLSALYRLFPESNSLEKINFSLNLFFDSREKSTNTLKLIADINTAIHYKDNSAYNPDIQQAYKDTEKILCRLLSTKVLAEQFITYLLEKVKIIRVKVPEDTDLNHYFEIMNTRGEQLEKHEILKSYMLNIIRYDKKLMFAFNTVWEACADMERYIQYGFPVSARDMIFDGEEWDTVQVSNLKDIADALTTDDESEKTTEESSKHPEDSLSILDILNNNNNFEANESYNEDAPQRFNSIINFSNFLLHVLRIQEKSDISLDDKRLIDIFLPYLKKASKKKHKHSKQFVKKFGFNLFKCKYLFDKYILKREYISGRDQWSLKRLKHKKYNNKRSVSYVNTFEDDDWNIWLVKILSMFHVSTPTQVYKHWLNGALYFLFQQEDHEYCEPDQYFEYLYNMAESFLLDRFLMEPESQEDYFEIIYENNCEPQNESEAESLNMDVLDTGTAVENFIFNYLDFKLWVNKYEEDELFDFTFRSSVEHYYPQHPIAKEEKIKERTCNNFGNLCLIDNKKNSRLSNHMPKAKMDYYHKVGADSLKQQSMMEVTKEKDNWDSKIILKEGKRMKKILLSPVEWE